MRINRKLIKYNKRIRRNIDFPNINSNIKSVAKSTDFNKVKNFINNKTIYPNLVSCVIKDRLGNNLFEIATAIGLAINNNCIPVFDNWNYSKYFDSDLTFDSELSESIPWNIYIEPRFAYTPIPYINNIKINGHFLGRPFLITKNIF
jgi:hypothetical protein